MFINKYGIIIKKKLKENFPEKYNELKKQDRLIPIIRDSQYEILNFKEKLLDENKSLLTKSKMIEILDDVNKEIEFIVVKINNCM